MRKPTEYEIEQSILLGGQISHKHEEFKEFAMLDPDTAFLIWYLKQREQLNKKGPNERIIMILETFGKLEFMRTTSELSKLSMILGDTRQTYNIGNVMNELRARAAK